jgi:hypothetical protein
MSPDPKNSAVDFGTPHGSMPCPMACSSSASGQTCRTSRAGGFLVVALGVAALLLRRARLTQLDEVSGLPAAVERGLLRTVDPEVREPAVLGELDPLPF